MNTHYKIYRLQPQDVNLFVELIDLLNEVFEEPQRVASPQQLNKLLAKQDFYAIIIRDENEVIGGLTAYELEQYYSDSKELFIYDIAVKTKYHHQGIGKALIGYLKEDSSQNGIENIFVQAHVEDEQAIKFYESTMGEGEAVSVFNFKTSRSLK